MSFGKTSVNAINNMKNRRTKPQTIYIDNSTLFSSPNAAATIQTLINVIAANSKIINIGKNHGFRLIP